MRRARLNLFLLLSVLAIALLTWVLLGRQAIYATKVRPVETSLNALQADFEANVDPSVFAIHLARAKAASAEFDSNASQWERERKSRQHFVTSLSNFESYLFWKRLSQDAANRIGSSGDGGWAKKWGDDAISNLNKSSDHLRKACNELRAGRDQLKAGN